MRPACVRWGHCLAMTYTATTRDRFRIGVTAVSGLTTVGALSVSGWLAGSVARDFESQQASASAETAQQTAQQQAQQRADRRAWRQSTRAEAAAARAARAPVHVALRSRPARTHVTVRYVQEAPAAAPGAGGQVTSYAAPPAAAPAAAHHSSPAPPVHHSPPPPPPPAPAPSSGS